MLKLNTSPVALRYPAGLHEDRKSVHHLIVLVPANVDSKGAIRRIWEIAQAAGIHVRLLSLCENPAEEPALRRELVLMASLLQDGGIHTEAKVEIGKNWIDAAKANYETGDIVVCFAEQHSGLLHKPLSEFLGSILHAPVYILSSPPLQQLKSDAHLQAIAWLGFMGIIIGFGILQANIVRLPEGWFQNILLLLSILPELGLIWVWNGLFR